MMPDPSPPPASWSRTPPETPGWYWYRTTWGDIEPVHVNDGFCSLGCVPGNLGGLWWPVALIPPPIPGETEEPPC